MVRKVTVMSAVSGTSGKSMRTLPDTDEWGFVKERSPTPEVFMGRAGGAGQRALEQKWVSKSQIWLILACYNKFAYWIWTF